MAQPKIQTSFASGEFAPALNARVDINKYHSAAALLRNFFVDYRGGVSTRMGTRYIATAKDSTNPVRLIPFQASSTLGYILEFGQNYIRFYSNGAVVLDGSNHPYTITSPYLGADLALIKYVQDVTSLILCHPNYPPQILTIVSANNWTLNQINFGSTIGPPQGSAPTSTLTSGTTNYAYVITSIDVNGQESVPNGFANVNNKADMRVSAGSNTVDWTAYAVKGAVSYNVYKAVQNNGGPIASGAQFGFMGNVTGTVFVDTNVVQADYSQTPPIAQNPFQGGSVASITLTVDDFYTTSPTITIAAPPAGGVQATASAPLEVNSVTGIVAPGAFVSNPVGTTVSLPNGVVLQITSATFVPNVWEVTGISLVNKGSVNGTAPTNPVGAISSVVPYTVAPTFNLKWECAQPVLITGGAGYLTPPAVTFSSGAAVAITTLGPQSAGNPSVPGFYQERLVLAAPSGALQTFYMSQPGSFFNFNVSNPVQADDAITGSIISGELNQIKSLVSVPTGLVALTSKAAWLINGSGGGSTITPSDAQAQSQAFQGANDLRPLQINFDILYGQAKGSYIRDLTYNFYVAIYTGTDISVLSSHLFFGYQINEWTYAEEPFKTVWAVRNDGVLLSLAFLKEQEIVGWAHHDTLGQFLSVASVVESVNTNFPAVTFGGSATLVDGVYVVVQRTLNGSVIKTIERLADRYFAYGMEDAWCVDAGLQSTPTLTGTGNTLTLSAASGNGVTATFANGFLTGANIGNVIRSGNGIMTITAVGSSTSATVNITQAVTYNDPTGIPFPTQNWTLWTPSTTFSGLDYLDGATVTGLADGIPIPPTTVVAGSITLAQAATKVTIGLAFTPQLQTLRIDLGEPTVQGKRKKIPAVTARVEDTLGLSVGTTFQTLVPMKDLVLGNVGTMSDAIVTNLVTEDARTLLDPKWYVEGQYCFEQDQPYPATILGVIPETVIGDTPK